MYKQTTCIFTCTSICTMIGYVHVHDVNCMSTLSTSCDKEIVIATQSHCISHECMKSVPAL